MHIVISPDSTAVAREAADALCDAIRRRPDLRLGLAAGTTPVPLYAELVRRYRHGELDESRLHLFSLDEFVGLARDHPQRFGVFLRRHLVDHLNVPASSASLLDSPTLEAADETARAYEQKIRDAGGIDVQILGIGLNGHLGFNEPGSSLGSRTRPVVLTDETIEQQRKAFGADDVPTWAVTMGIGTILDARALMLLATGRAKAAIVAAALEGPITASLPASSLQLHPGVTVFLDEEAASLLARKDYYRRSAAAMQEIRHMRIGERRH